MTDPGDTAFTTAIRIVDEMADRLWDRTEVGPANMVIAMVEYATELALSMEGPQEARHHLIGIIDAYIALAKAKMPEINDPE